MQFSICYLLVVAVFAVKVSASYNCKDRHCYISTNDKNENIFNCTLGKAQQDLVTCIYNPNERKLILTTNDQSFVKIDKIAPDALKRLVSGIYVNKFFFNNFQVNSLDSEDFNGLSGITEMRIENPISLAFDTFLALQTKNMIFVLTISCYRGNMENSFKEIYMKNNRFRLFSEHCNKTRICEYSNCESKDLSQVTRIIATNETASKNYQLAYRSCKLSQACLSRNISTKPIPKSTVKLFPTSSQPSKSAKLKDVSSSGSNSNYDTLMWVVLFLTGINSIVILGILLFLIIWWKKFTNSAANKKHTIILEDDEDTKYLKLSPYA